MQTIATIGLDIAKSVFQVHGVDATGQVVIRRQLKRRFVLASAHVPDRRPHQDRQRSSEQRHRSAAALGLPKARPQSRDLRTTLTIQRPFVDLQMMLSEHRHPSFIIAGCRTILDVATKNSGGQTALYSITSSTAEER
jgi:hypothetical protein